MYEKVNLKAVLSPYVVAEITVIPDDFGIMFHWSQIEWETDLLIVECFDAGIRGVLMQYLGSMSWVNNVYEWAGGKPSHIETINELYKGCECRYYIKGLKGKYGEVCILPYSESLVEKVEAEEAILRKESDMLLS